MDFSEINSRYNNNNSNNRNITTQNMWNIIMKNKKVTRNDRKCSLIKDRFSIKVIQNNLKNVK